MVHHEIEFVACEFEVFLHESLVLCRDVFFLPESGGCQECGQYGLLPYLVNVVDDLLGCF